MSFPRIVVSAKMFTLHKLSKGVERLGILKEREGFTLTYSQKFVEILVPRVYPGGGREGWPQT